MDRCHVEIFGNRCGDRVGSSFHWPGKCIKRWIAPNGIRANPDSSPQIQRDSCRDRSVTSERRATRISSDEGMDEVESVVERRNAYIVMGIDTRDNDMRVVIDRRTGEVLKMR